MRATRPIIFLFILGLACFIYGAGKSYIDAAFTPQLSVLAAFGVLCVVISVLNIRTGWRQAGLAMSPGRVPVALLGMLLWAALAGAAYFAAVIANTPYDLTEAKQHTLSGETVSLLGSLEEPIKFTAFYVGIAPKYLEDLLNAYEKHGHGRVTAEIIDPLVNLGYAAQFGEKLTAQEQRLIVQGGGERRDIDFSKAPLTENDLNNAIIQIVRPRRTACFLSGHNESDPGDESFTGMKKFAQKLEANNITAKNIILATAPEVPAECSVLVIAGPKENLLPEEEERINAYLKKGGDAFIMVENTVVSTREMPLNEDLLDKNPSLNALLKPWGVKVKSDVVVDLANHASGDVGSPATRNYMAHRAIVNQLDYTFYVRPRSISMLPDRSKTVKLVPIVMTESSEASWGESNRYLEVKFSPEEDRPGPVPIAFVIVELKEPGDGSDTRIVLFTDADFLTNNYIDYYNNALMGLKMVNWLTETDYQRFVDEKGVEVPRLDLTSREKRYVVLVLLMAPLLILMSGVCVWMARK